MPSVSEKPVKIDNSITEVARIITETRTVITPKTAVRTANEDNRPPRTEGGTERDPRIAGRVQPDRLKSTANYMTFRLFLQQLRGWWGHPKLGDLPQSAQYLQILSLIDATLQSHIRRVCASDAPIWEHMHTHAHLLT